MPVSKLYGSWKQMTIKIQKERGENMSETLENITRNQEEKRLEDFKKIAENWDKLPERAQGKIDGIISMAASAFLKETKKAG